jgi:hypothetical protein
VDSTQIVLEDKGGGYVAPPPQGSTCSPGVAKFTIALQTQKLDWSVCQGGGPSVALHLVAGTRVLLADEYAKLWGELLALKVSHAPTCIIDKPVETVTITMPAGSFEYRDGSGSCHGGTAIDGVDDALEALRQLVPPTP